MAVIELESPRATPSGKRWKMGGNVFLERPDLPFIISVHYPIRYDETRPRIDIKDVTQGDHLVLPVSVYAQLTRTMLQSSVGRLSAELLETLGLEAYAFGSAPRHVLQILHTEEVTNQHRFPGLDIIPLAVKYCWGERWREGREVSLRAQSVLDILEKGPADFDLKAANLDTDQTFDNLLGSIRTEFADVVADERMKEYPDGHVYPVKTIYAFDQKGSNYPLDTFDAIPITSANGYRDAEEFAYFSLPDQLPMVKIQQVPIPVKPELTVFEVAVGTTTYTDRWQKPSDFVLGKHLERSESYDFHPLYTIHLTAIPSDGHSDWRWHRYGSSWSNGVRALVDGAKGTVTFGKDAIQAWQRPLVIRPGIFRHPLFALSESLRSHRALVLREHISPYEMRQAELIRIREGVSRLGISRIHPSWELLIPSSTARTVSRGVYRVLQDNPTPSEQLRTEMTGDMATNALAAPIGSLTIMEKFETFRWFRGFEGLTRDDLVLMRQYIFDRLVEYLDWTHFRKQRGRFVYTPAAMYEIDGEYQKALTRPDLDENSGRLSWEDMPSGIDLTVEALEYVRRRKGLTTVDSTQSAIERFCDYFDLVFSRP